MHVALHSGPAAMLSLERSNKEDASTNITKIDLAGFVSMPFSSLPKEFSKLTGSFSVFWSKSQINLIVILLLSIGGIVFVCGVCSNTYRKRYLLLYHLRIHLNQFPYTCLNCSSGFETLSSLTFHQIQVHPSNLYCRRCGQSFETLDNHECIEIRPFVCEGCGEGFLVFSKLLEHSDVCEDYSYFSLALREYRFHYKGYYSCHTCTLNFSTLSEMIRHRMALHVDWEMSPSPSSPLSPLSPHTPAQEMQAPPIPSSKPFQTLLSSTRFTKKPLLRLKRVSLHSKNPKLKREVAPEFDMKSPSGFFGGKAHTEKKVDSYVRTEVEEEMDISCSNGISSCNSLALYNEESNSSLAVAEKKEEVLLTFGEGNTNSNNNNNNNPTRRSSKRICDRENLSEWSSLLPNNCKMSDRHRQKLKTMAHSQEYKVHIDPLCIFKQVKDKNSKVMKRSKTVMQHNKTGIDGRADSSSSSMDLLSSFNESSDSAGNGVNDSSGEDVGFHATCNGKTSVSHGRNPFLLCRKMSLNICPLSANSNSF